LLGLGIIAILVLLSSMQDRAEEHGVAIESFKVAGLRICMDFFTTQAEQSVCVAEVLAEATAAEAAQRSFDTSNVPSIPAGQWP